MKHLLLKLYVFAGFLVIVAMVPVSLQAQSPDTDTTLIRQQDSTEAQQQQLELTYRGQLEEYRTAERRYLVAHEQLKQLNTLAALEEAVQATKQAMFIRDQVLITYFQTVRLKLTDTHGISLESKNKSIQDILAIEAQLNTHLVEVQQVTNRSELLVVIESFTKIKEQLHRVAYYALSLIGVGRMQTSYDKTMALMDEVDDIITQRNTDLELAEKQRAYQELQTAADATGQELTELSMNLATEDLEKSGYGDSDYTQMLRDLQPIYSQLKRIHSFIQEVTHL